MKEKKIKIKDKIVEYSVKYSKVKYIRYELKHGKLRVVLPKRCSIDVEEAIHNKENLIYKKLVEYDKQKERLSRMTKGMDLVYRSLPELRQLVNNYIEKYESILNVKVNRVQFRDTVYKWGSCSSLNNITFSKNLKYLPDELVSYIVYHELSHLLVMAHNDEFFNIIKKEFPDYKKFDEELKLYLHMISNLH